MFRELDEQVNELVLSREPRAKVGSPHNAEPSDAPESSASGSGVQDALSVAESR